MLTLFVTAISYFTSAIVPSDSVSSSKEQESFGAQEPWASPPSVSANITVWYANVIVLRIRHVRANLFYRSRASQKNLLPPLS